MDFKTYFFIVSLKIQDVIKCCSGVNVDHVSVDSSKQMTPVAKYTLTTKKSFLAKLKKIHTYP